MPHLVLFGDSTLDNAAYVRGGPDVAAQLAGLVPPDWRVTLAAVDGARADDVPRQVAAAPADATHLVLSVGGNNALAHADILNRPARTSAEVLGALADARDAFEVAYRGALDAVLAPGLPTVACTVYNGNLAQPAGRLAVVALTVFNDVILRAAVQRGVPVVELRLVCTDPDDYANPIEPSVAGGAKIARALAMAVGAVGASHTGARVTAL
jgi:hypothetical protein